MKKILLFTLLAASWQSAFSQCNLSINPSQDTLNCGGGNVNLQAVSSGGGTFALANDFNLGNAGSGWNISPAGTFTNPCGPALDGTTYMWMGDMTAAPRTLQTAPLDVSCGGDICFDFKMAVQGLGSPCEGPDLTSEGVYLDWSIDGGVTWTTINYFQPNPGGCLNSSNGGSGCDGDYTAWANYCFTIPPVAQTTTTIFQWWQSGSSGNLYDHWGIDNVTISSLNCSGYYYDWTHIPGSPDDSLITENITTTTTFDVLYTNGVDDTCYASITIVVDTTLDVSLTSTNETCDDANNGTIATTVGGGFNPYTYVLVGPSGSTNSTGNFNSLIDGNYTMQVTDNIGCYGEQTVTIQPGNPLSGNANTVLESCNGANDGSAALTGSGGNGNYTYAISGPISASNSSGNFIGLPSGNYSVNVTDNQGCAGTFTFTLNAGPTVNGNINTTPETCFEYNNALAVPSANGGTGPYTYILSGPVNDTISSGNFNNLPAGNYSVLVTDANGCTDVLTFTLNNATPVVADFTASPVVGPAPLTVNFTNLSTGATNFNWIFGDGNTSNASDPSNTYTTESTFTAILIASNGPCVDTAMIDITTLTSSFFLPNVFSPNGDGDNDEFEFQPMNVVSLSARIYNRWGTQVAEITSPTGKWDGKDKGGKECPDGVYYYVLEINTAVEPTVYDPNPRELSGTQFTFNGTVTLIRKK